MKVLGAAFVTLMNMRSGSVPRPRGAERYSAPEPTAQTFAVPTVPKADRGMGRQHCDCRKAPYG
jgi:hypothetical protein